MKEESIEIKRRNINEDSSDEKGTKNVRHQFRQFADVRSVQIQRAKSHRCTFEEV
jgi:hypothetical protein